MIIQVESTENNLMTSMVGTTTIRGGIVYNGKKLLICKALTKLGKLLLLHCLLL